MGEAEVSCDWEMPPKHRRGSPSSRKGGKMLSQRYLSELRTAGRDLQTPSNLKRSTDSSCGLEGSAVEYMCTLVEMTRW